MNDCGVAETRHPFLFLVTLVVDDDRGDAGQEAFVGSVLRERRPHMDQRNSAA
jgi:hypothetical protein